MTIDVQSNQHLPPSKCFHGHIYELHSRNLYLGLFRRPTMSFIGIRLKFHDRFLDEEYHYDQGPPHGTAKPKQCLGKCPVSSVIDHDKWDSENLIFSYLNFLETLHYEYGDTDIIKLFTGSDLDIKPWID